MRPEYGLQPSQCDAGLELGRRALLSEVAGCGSVSEGLFKKECHTLGDKRELLVLFVKAGSLLFSPLGA